jgi:hypothetical protein
MLHSRLHRLTTLLLVSAYLAANTIGGMLHDHAAHSDHEHAAACHHEHVGQSDQDHDHDHDDHVEPEAGVVGICAGEDGPDHEGCAVCRFISQRSMPAPACSVGTLCQLNVELGVIAPPRPAVEPLRTTHSRAPPALG